MYIDLVKRLFQDCEQLCVSVSVFLPLTDETDRQKERQTDKERVTDKQKPTERERDK